MEVLPLVDFTKVKKKRSAHQQEILTKYSTNADLDDFIVGNKTTIEEEKPSENEIKEEVPKFEEEYSYDMLLNRVVCLIKSKNPSLAETSKGAIKIPLPVIKNIRSLRSIWVNFLEVCTALNRATEHLFQFVLAELGTEGSVNADNQLMIKGRYNNKHIESLLKKYVHQYVQCSNCKSSNTTLRKDITSRLQVMFCNSCKSEKSVAPIKARV